MVEQGRVKAAVDVEGIVVGKVGTFGNARRCSSLWRMDKS